MAKALNPPSDYIRVHHARVNNLQDIDVDIPRGKLVVITGLSGSGKSSLAFDTLYAEGQRRYVESLSTYARQFMGKMAKPECDWIHGLPPAIAIEQKVNTRNPRSTVGTSTEIYDYMRLLFGRIGHTYSPVSGLEVRRHNPQDVIETALTYPAGTRLAVTAPISLPLEGRTMAQQLDIYLKEGYTRLMKSESAELLDIAELLKDPETVPATPEGFNLLVDRLMVSPAQDEISRLTDSVETAFFEGHEACTLWAWGEAGSAPRRHDFSRRFEADGIAFLEPSEQMFNFNNPYGACPTCEGFGRTMGIDERLVIPNQTLSIYDDAVAPWRGEKMSEWKRALMHAAPHSDFPIHRPYNQLTKAQKDFLWHGNQAFEGIDGFFSMVQENLYKIQYRVMLARYRGKTICPTCHGGRLRPEATYVKVGGKDISSITQMPVTEALAWFSELPRKLGETDKKISERLLLEITTRLTFLERVGLGYLTLDRLSNTLSGGESQRINLATSLGSSLVGSMYILDEPSIGLHSRDTDRLISVLKDLREPGNTVVVVEHDEDIIRNADYLIDVGPKAGRLGGNIVFQGAVKDLDKASESLTLQYLDGRLKIPVPKSRRPWKSWIEVRGAREHNLKNINVRFPLGVMTVVTGVSGSGKSTLVRDILYKALCRKLDQTGDAPGEFDGLAGDLPRIGAVEFVDQNPIGRSTRSNPATYLKAFDEIRRLYADQPLSQQMGYSPAYFSFNAEGGRCEECKGEGVINIEMQFMADITIPCESCGGKRYKRDVLEVLYRDKSITDVLDMTVAEAVDFFNADAANPQAQKVAKRLQPLLDVGLGYVKLGQPSSTLSGGENQRVKLASFLAQDSPTPTMFIFDEPSTGLHFHDISTLLDSFQRLISHGHSIVIIEHNLDIIKVADHVIDIGPEGGDAGGQLVAEGTPEEVAQSQESRTAPYLAAKLKGIKNP